MPSDYARQLSAKAEISDVQIINSERERTDWKAMQQSLHARNTVNPIRKIVDAMAVAPNPSKAPIKLHLGDPTLTGKLPPCPVVTEAMHEAVASHAYDGYGPSVGDGSARQAIVDKYSTPDAPFNADDVILASGASHALQLAIEALANPGDNILIPGPGFPLYSTLCRPHGVEDRQYRLNMKKGALIDLFHMESLIDERTRAIIINNPSNPTGAVFPREHLECILSIANRYRVPIIADEIYGDLTYDGAVFIPIATLSPKVPVITCDGIAKRWLVPGWRLGWCIVHDRYDVLADIKRGMIALSQKIVGPCALVQGALPKILRETPDSFFDHVKSVLSANARVAYETLKKVPGLHPLRAQGAMYMMVGIDRRVYGEETPFVQGLIKEQSVFCLPGSAFSAPGWFRIVLAYPEDVTREACDRITEYCRDHSLVPVMEDVTAAADKTTTIVPAFTRSPLTQLEDEGCNSADEGCEFESATPEDSDDNNSFSPLFP